MPLAPLHQPDRMITKARFGCGPGRTLVAIESPWPHGEFERLPELLADLMQCRAAVIAVGGITSGRAAKAATTLAADDPVKFASVTGKGCSTDLTSGH
jgi:hypothetical protein